MIIVSDAASCAAVTRQQLGQVLIEWGCGEELIDDAKLVATELVTNGMLHGGGCTSLAAIFDGQSLRLEVGDRGGAIPQLHHYDDEAATGRGSGPRRGRRPGVGLGDPGGRQDRLGRDRPFF